MVLTLFYFQSSGLWRPINNDYDIVECGTRLKITNIVGGKTAKLGDYPYMALLGSTQQNPRTKKTETFYTCGGSLINKWYVLTAAHCVQTGTGEEIKLRYNGLFTILLKNALIFSFWR